MTPDRAEAFIRANTALLQPHHVAEIHLHLADEAHELWQRTEDELQALGIEPPFWAFAWAGGQGLARYLLDHPGEVAGRGVLDFATGSGLVAIAAAKAGAVRVVASDIDPFCASAVALNSRANATSIEFRAIDLIGTDDGWDVVTAGDIFYDRSLAARAFPWLRELRARGARVLLGDPGRSYLPRDGLRPCVTYEVEVTRALEDAQVKRTTVWEFD